MNQTRRFLGGRQPLCGIGVTSRMDMTLRPAEASAWMADSRPLPGPCTRTCTRRRPMLTASRAQFSAATVAANGVLFLEPLKPALPAVPHESVLPRMSVMVISTLLKVAEMWATPSLSTTRLARLPPVVGLAGAVITSWSPFSFRRWRGADPSWSGRWYGCAGHGPAGPGGAGCHDSCQCP